MSPENTEDLPMKNLIDLTDKRIIIAGASSGIGRQTAVTLSEVGAKLILIARREDKLRETLDMLEGSGHGIIPADLSETDAIEGLFKRIKEEYGAADGLVYCAGVNSSVPLQLLKPESLKNTFEINFFAFVETVRQLAKRGRFNEGTRIVAVSSNAAIRGDKAHTAYSAPAVTETEIYKQYAQSSESAGGSEKALLDRQYLGLIQPEDVAETIAYLMSGSARMITGVTLPVDGGLSTS